jgi:phosphatidylserine decarboxylase
LRFAQGSLPTITALFAAAVAGFIVTPRLGAALAVPLALVMWFYRDPDRAAPGDPSVWVSPADGRVVEIVEGASDPYAGTSVKIGIFMNGFDVHVNRFPTAATVEEVVHVPGKKTFAFAPKASELNERLYVRALTGDGRTTVVQIAGVMARRIVCYTKTGARLARGERYGMIRLGSKVDVYLPAGVVPAVKIGDRVRAGESVIGVVTKCETGAGGA